MFLSLVKLSNKQQQQAILNFPLNHTIKLLCNNFIIATASTLISSHKHHKGVCRCNSGYKSIDDMNLHAD